MEDIQKIEVSYGSNSQDHQHTLTHKPISSPRLSTGVDGLDEILHGGCLPGHAYLLRGGPGSGKTTLGLHILATGANRGERTLFITLGETVEQIQANAAQIGIDLTNVHFLDLSPSTSAFTAMESYDIFSPAEVEREPMTQKIIEEVQRLQPQRVFLDSITQFRYLSNDAFQFHKQVLSFLRFLKEQQAKGSMKILMIDDSPYDRALIQRRIQKEFQDAEFVEIIRRSDLDEALTQQNFDLALTDYRLQWTDGLWLLHTIKAHFPLLPVVMVTDTGSEEIATEGMKEGLSDYVLKRELHRLPLAMKESLEKARLLAERKQLEEQVRQAQKMESLGQLVSGIAHDFNNILAGILGYTDQSLSKVDVTHPVYEGLQHTRESTLRAAQMVRQLLAFSRHQVLEPTYVDVNGIVANLLDFIKKVIGEHIEIVFVPSPEIQMVYADKVQLEQVVMNLCINARDAMPAGGQLCITTQNTMSNKAQQRTQTGEFVQLTVQDTGTGMDKQTRERIFEPFFTTKEVGKGTGLGLSTVHGIIGQHKGFITVESTHGKGTSFSVYLPRVDHAPIEVQQAPEAEPTSQTGTETILLVEDDQDLRELIQAVLEEHGYTVLSASDGEEGLALLERADTSIELIISDMMTPKLGGKDLYKKLAQSGSTSKFLFMSGYLPDHLGSDFHVERETQFLQKPFDLDELTRKVRLVLEA